VRVSDIKCEGVMGTDTMGRVIVAARIENLGHRVMVERGFLAPDQVQFVDVSDAVVDPSVLNFCMPTKLLQQLDLMPYTSRTERTSTGLEKRRVYGVVRLTVQGRECTSDVVELPDDQPVLIGRVPLQLLDFVIDLPDQRLTGNPAHGGEQMFEMYQVSLLGDIECLRD
jgi:hypothetical protein